jgi:hypothetical protein
MFKRTVILASLLFAISVPAAVAGTGTPPAAGTSPAAKVSPGDLVQRVDALHDRIKKAVDRFVARCAKNKADGAKCKAAAETGLARLQKISDRIDSRVAKIKERCASGTSTQAVPKACAHADEVVTKLRTVQSEVKELARKIQAWLDDPASASSGSSGSAGDASGIGTLDGLAADLAAAQAAAGN